MMTKFPFITEPFLSTKHQALYTLFKDQMRITKYQHRAKTTKNDKAATLAAETCISKEKICHTINAQ